MSTSIDQHNAASESIENFLERLCELFDDELERQENVLAICHSQGEAARAHDREFLDSRTESLVVLLEDADKAQEARFALLAKVVKGLELSPEKQSLSHLIEVVPEPWRRRMSEFQASIQATLKCTKETVRANAAMMRRNLRVIENSLDIVKGEALCKGNSYNPEGKEHKERRADAALIDTHG